MLKMIYLVFVSLLALQLSARNTTMFAFRHLGSVAFTCPLSSVPLCWKLPSIVEYTVAGNPFDWTSTTGLDDSSVVGNFKYRAILLSYSLKLTILRFSNFFGIRKFEYRYIFEIFIFIGCIDIPRQRLGAVPIYMLNWQRLRKIYDNCFSVHYKYGKQPKYYRVKLCFSKNTGVYYSRPYRAVKVTTSCTFMSALGKFTSRIYEVLKRPTVCIGGYIVMLRGTNMQTLRNVKV